LLKRAGLVGKRRRNPAPAILGVTAAVGTAAFAWGSLVERNRFTIRREFVPVLEPGSRPVTVLHISDLHLAPWQEGRQEWVRSLVALEPDLVINTGDNLGHPEGNAAVEYALAPFAGIPGVYVHGSNDYFAPSPKNPFGYFARPSLHVEKSVRLDTERLERYFEDALGWRSLNNAATSMDIGGSSFEFFGTNDAHRNWDKLGTLPVAIEAMREEASWQEDQDGPVSIGVTHAPYQRVLNSFVTNGADVIFAGHTHGGQVRIPGLPALVTNCDIPRRQASGLSVWHHAQRGAYLNVSAGIGTSIYAPVRFACPPEAVLVTLVEGDIGYS
jgi:predicted MPP superfamily phosphohydrolase